ncbi:hypothetical protein [Streptomyces sp. CCNWLW237]
MTDWLHVAAVLTTVTGLLSASLTYTVTRQVSVSLGVLLDFLSAAGLIRLADDPSWGSIAAAAAVIAVRKLIGPNLGRPPDHRAAPR